MALYRLKIIHEDTTNILSTQYETLNRGFIAPHYQGEKLTTANIYLQPSELNVNNFFVESKILDLVVFLQNIQIFR